MVLFFGFLTFFNIVFAHCLQLHNVCLAFEQSIPLVWSHGNTVCVGGETFERRSVLHAALMLGLNTKRGLLCGLVSVCLSLLSQFWNGVVLVCI